MHAVYLWPLCLFLYRMLVVRLTPSLLFGFLSRFHLAATRGHLDCLNLILGHNVDVTATDASGEFQLDQFSHPTPRFCNLGFYLFIFQFFDFHLTLGSKLTGHFTALDNTRKVPGDNLLNRPTVKAHLRHRSPVAKWSACGLCQELCPEMVRKYLRFHNQSFITANHSRQGHIVLTNHKCNNGLQCLQCGSINCVVKHRWVTRDDFLCLKEVKATKKLHFKLGNKCY